ncbi:hypothetical protein WICMUC_001488 [Wickerhamomyces mucosus]|uniref:Exportin-T n=1 Tax=Wickerhamomyces mucosus TaxID=1378264 RepID=A0A9P8THE6_9ASCO|nr:hypothetical protein WICMUC_001488 [Wickerhamomyces mucosus]
MEEQIKQAVEIAINPSSDYNLKQEAINFITEIKSSSNSIPSFISILLNQQINNEELKFIAIQTICEFIPNVNQDVQNYIRSNLFQYFKDLISINKIDSIYLRNKLAESFSILFCNLYLTSWSNFFKDFIQLITDDSNNGNQLAIDQFLRILLNIHSEIGDQLIIRDRLLIERNNLLKDSIRINDMNQLTLIWKNFLKDYNDNDEIIQKTLQIIGGYISWIDITLIISSDYINLILQFLNSNSSSIKSTCCLTLSEIISKKMKPDNKLELLSLLNLTQKINILNLNHSIDLEFLESLAKLFNSIGLELTYILESSDSNLNLKINSNNQICLEIFPSILKILSNPYDDISQQIFPFLSNWLSILKKKNNNLKISNNNENNNENFLELTNIHLEILSNLLIKIMKKMKFDSDDDGLDEDSNSEFFEFRSKLKTFQDSIALISSDLYLDQIILSINQSLSLDNEIKDWRILEFGLYQLSNFADSLRNNLLSNNIPKNSINQSKPYLIFQEIVIKLINSNLIVSINHPLIQLLFFELIVRHYNFLNNSNDKSNLTIHILTLFNTQYALFNSNEKVKLRCWYLFFRFVKLTKPILIDESFILNLINNLSNNNLLLIEAELPLNNNNEDDDEILEYKTSKFDNQLYLFESLGLLISLIPSNQIDLKLKILDLLLIPIFNELQNIITKSKSFSTIKTTAAAATSTSTITTAPSSSSSTALASKSIEEQTLILQAHHLLMSIGTIARGFEYDSTSPNKKYPLEIVERFNNSSEVVLITLESLSSNEIIRDASRFAFARFIPILKSSINSYLSRLISILLSSSDLKFNELTDFLGFIGQIIHNFNKDELIYQLLNELFTPLSNKIFQMLNDKGENNVYELMPDIIREKTSLNKAFLNLLITLPTNNVTSLLITEINKPNLATILQHLFQSANNLDELQVSKLSIGALALFINVFGSDSINDPEDKFAGGLRIEGISQFLLENSIKLSFEIPFQNEKFDIKDAQYRFLTDELANLLKVLYKVKSQDSIVYLKEIYFPQIQLPSNVGDDIITNLINLDNKQFKKYFINFILQFK